jgi:hypothetical protein
VFRREGEFEAAGGLIGEPGSGLFGDVGRMIVEDQLNRRMGRISGIEKLKEFDELAAAMAIPDQGVNRTSEQIDTGQQADRAVTVVFIIAREGCMGAGLGRQIRCRRRNRLDLAWQIVRVPVPRRINNGFQVVPGRPTDGFSCQCIVGDQSRRVTLAPRFILDGKTSTHNLLNRLK